MPYWQNPPLWNHWCCYSRRVINFTHRITSEPLETTTGEDKTWDGFPPKTWEGVRGKPQSWFPGFTCLMVKSVDSQVVSWLFWGWIYTERHKCFAELFQGKVCVLLCLSLLSVRPWSYLKCLLRGRAGRKVYEFRANLLFSSKSHRWCLPGLAWRAI